jgi:uncharacterized paraquat-inducible protein A
VRPRNLTALALILIAFGLLIPGLTKDLMTLTAFVEFMGQRNELFSMTRSILQTVKDLHESGNDFVAGLILLFSVVVPIGKGILLLIVLAVQHSPVQKKIFRFVGAISKWSMADVFLVGIYIAYLSANANDKLEATLGVGFYYFAAYCLVSIASHQFMKLGE